MMMWCTFQVDPHRCIPPTPFTDTVNLRKYRHFGPKTLRT